MDFSLSPISLAQRDVEHRDVVLAMVLMDCS